MVIKPITAIGVHKPLCVAKVRVAAGLKTNTAQHRAWKAKRAGIPVDQCGHRADFTIDGEHLCRPHAGAAALAHLLNEGK
jgi:hypothetical protein